MKFKVFTNFDSNLNKIWTDLEKNSNIHCFQTFSWSKHYWECFNDNYELQIVVVFSKSEPKILYPFVIEKYLNFKILKFLGQKQNDYNKPIIIKNFDISSKFENDIKNINKVINNYDLCLFSKINLEEKYFTVLKPFGNKIKNNNSDFKSKYILLEKKWEDQKKQFNSKTIKDTYRQINKIKKHGDLLFDYLYLNKDEIKQLLFQKRKQCFKMGWNDFLSSSCEQNFFLKMPRDLSNEYKVQLSSIKINNKIIASHWGVFSKNYFYYILPSYDQNWSKYSPGKILLTKLIQWSIKQNIKVFDFTVGDHEYKNNWCNKEKNLDQVISYKTFRGFIYIKIWKFKNYLKNFIFLKNSIKSIRKLKYNFNLIKIYLGKSCCKNLKIF